MDLSSRTPSEQDWVDGLLALINALDKSGNQKFGVELDIHAIMTHFRLCEAAVINDKYLVCWNVNPLWFNPEVKVLNEQLILDIHPEKSGTLFPVLRTLVEISRERGCAKAVIGDLLMPDKDKYRRVLTKLGFEVVNTYYAM